jgi:hypothetical protein
LAASSELYLPALATTRPVNGEQHGISVAGCFRPAAVFFAPSLSPQWIKSWFSRAWFCPVYDAGGLMLDSTAESEEVVDDGCARLRKSSYAELRFWRR